MIQNEWPGKLYPLKKWIEFWTLLATISNPSVNGERKLPDTADTLPQTPGDHPNTSTRTVTLDGVEYRVYVELFIVAPKIVN